MGICLTMSSHPIGNARNGDCMYYITSTKGKGGCSKPTRDHLLRSRKVSGISDTVPVGVELCQMWTFLLAQSESATLGCNSRACEVQMRVWRCTVHDMRTWQVTVHN